MSDLISDLKRRRKELRLTRRAFSELAGISFTRYWLIEDEIQYPTSEEEQAIEDVFDADRNKALLKLAKWDAASKPASDEQSGGGM